MFSLYSIYKKRYTISEQDLLMFQCADMWIATNLVTNGWSILDSYEIGLLFHPSGLYDEEFANKLYLYGIAQKNGHYIYDAPKEDEESIYLFEINVTNQCNLRCTYCLSNFNYSQNIEFMSLEIAKSFCNQLKAYVESKKLETIIIEFSGGEPFLNFEIIKCIMENLKNLGIKILYNIQTNGTHIKQEYLDFLVDYNNIQLAISLDGYSKEHNINRINKLGESVYLSILENLNVIKESGIPYTFVTVVNKNNIKEIDNIVQYFLDMGVFNFSLLPLLTIGKAKNNNMNIDENEFVEKIWLLHESILKRYYRNNNQITLERNMGIFYYYLFQPERNFMCHRSPCGAGLNIVSIAPNGNIFPCYGFQGVEDFLIGNVKDTNFDSLNQKTIVKKLRDRRVENIAECSQCNYRIWCQGGCASNAFLSSGEILSKDSVKCEINKKLIQKSLESIVNRDEEDIDYFIALSKKWMGESKND
ncbi:MAG: radical SAM protein [Halanaerobiales bacterium]|nr:radical SAM protein [Halanaerobiales bacterium]